MEAAGCQGLPGEVKLNVFTFSSATTAPGSIGELLAPPTSNSLPSLCLGLVFFLISDVLCSSKRTAIACWCRLEWLEPFWEDSEESKLIETFSLKTF